MTTPQAPPETCSCGSGGVVIRCAAGHAELASPRPGAVKVRCPHRDPGGERCGKLAYVRVGQRQGSAGGPGPAGGPWAAEGPPVPWRDLLGEAVPGAGEWCAGNGCPCGGPDMRYTNGQTVIACPDPRCGADCWEPSPAALERADRHRAALAARSARSGAVAAVVPQAQLDEQARQIRRAGDEMRRRVAAVLADDKLTDETRSDLEWFAAEIDAARTLARLEDLAGQLRDTEIRRRSFFRPYAVPADYDQDQDEDEGSQDQDEDDGQAAGLPGPLMLALPAPPAAWPPDPLMPPMPARPPRAATWPRCRRCGGPWDPDRPGTCPCGVAEFAS